MTDTRKKVVSGAVTDKTVRMYPANTLKEPVRKFSETFHAVDLYEQKYFQAKQR